MAPKPSKSPRGRSNLSRISAPLPRLTLYGSPLRDWASRRLRRKKADALHMSGGRQCGWSGERLEVNLATLSIKRPVATTLLTLGVVLAGFFAYLKLPVAPLPQIDFPTITVFAAMPGAS